MLHVHRQVEDMIKALELLKDRDMEAYLCRKGVLKENLQVKEYVDSSGAYPADTLRPVQTADMRQDTLRVQVCPSII